MKHWPKNVDEKILIPYKREIKIEFPKLNKSDYVITKEKIHKENVV